MRRLLPLLLISCATAPAPTAEKDAAPAQKGPPPLAEEVHYQELRQLTFGGENAEAYWSFDGKRLSLQRHVGDQKCDRIFTLQALPTATEPVQVSDGKGATTCSHYFPDGKEILFASTELGGAECPPRPDMSLGYVWALYDTYDIYKANADGSNARRLTTEKGYDAEATVCGKDGSIIFTSTRDNDIELYRMDKDGGNVKRLTFTPGYDGGAFFNRDCTKIVWRASRPKPGKELDDFQSLLSKGLVRPTKLELYVANADGSDAHQVTYLDAASFAPFWYPGQERIIFASNHGDPKGREFDLWAINADGTQLERVTHAKGFDGFPMFTPDGQWLAFASNRATPEGQHDTNLFLAKWRDAPPVVAEQTGADRAKPDVQFLADPKLAGRGIGTPELEQAGAWLEKRFQELGLEPAGSNGYRDDFEVVTAVKSKEGATHLSLEKKKLDDASAQPMGWSKNGTAKGKLVLAGYGIVDPELGIDDYAGLDVKNKVVLVRRFVPENEKLKTPEAQRNAGDLRKKAFVARSKGAVAMLVVDWPAAPKDAKDFKAPPEAAFPSLSAEGFGDAGMPVMLVHRAALEALMPKLEKKQPVDVEVQVELEQVKSKAFNVVGRLKASASSGGPVVLGAHYDHLGLGGRDSLAPDKHEPHLGADDNASGVAGVLEAVRLLKQHPEDLKRDVVVVAFSAEEAGDLGSSHFVRERADTFKGAVAMLNLDMVGRMRENKLSVLGAESAEGWSPLIDKACAEARVSCNASGDGYGPSDHTPFYAAGLPVLHFFTGAHFDYHKPSDTFDKLNYGGLAHAAQVVAGIVSQLASAESPALTYKKVAQPVRGDARSFNASLGTVPDYGGPPHGQAGVLLADVRPGGGADKGGMKRGDIIVKLGKNEVRSVEDLMYVLMSSRPGETVNATVLRDGKPVQLEVTFQEGRKH